MLTYASLTVVLQKRLLDMGILLVLVLQLLAVPVFSVRFTLYGSQFFVLKN